MPGVVTAGAAAGAGASFEATLALDGCKCLLVAMAMVAGMLGVWVLCVVCCVVLLLFALHVGKAWDPFHGRQKA